MKSPNHHQFHRKGEGKEEENKEEEEEKKPSLKSAYLEYYKQAYRVPSHWKSWPTVITSETHDHTFKLSVIGSERVGKTTLFNRFVVS
jgi:hypothetical protein